MRKKNREALEDTAGSLIWITQMKGIAMIAIILFHWGSKYASGILKHAANMGAQGNHIFFILSAFGLCLAVEKAQSDPLRQMNWTQWFQRRAVKLLLPYYISVAIIFISIVGYGLLVQELPGTLQRMNLNVSTGLSTFLLYRNFIGSHTTAINTPWWFAITIMQFYMLFPVLYGLLRTKGWIWLGVSSFLINVLYIACYALILRSSSNAFRCFPLQFIFSFSMGLMLCRLYLDNGASFVKRFSGLGALVVGLFLELIGVYLAFQGKAGKEFNDLLFGPGFFLLVFYFVNRLSKFDAPARFFRLVGEYSLPLFLLHAPYIYLVFPSKTAMGIVEGFVYFSVYLIFLVLLAWSSSKLIFERVPALRRPHVYSPS